MTGKWLLAEEVAGEQADATKGVGGEGQKEVVLLEKITRNRKN